MPRAADPAVGDLADVYPATRPADGRDDLLGHVQHGLDHDWAAAVPTGFWR